MGKASKPKDDSKEYKLTEREYNYVKILQMGLQFHTWQQKIVSGFLYHVCNTRLGYPDNVNLLFEIDFDKDDQILKVKTLPADPASAAPSADH